MHKVRFNILIKVLYRFPWTRWKRETYEMLDIPTELNTPKRKEPYFKHLMEYEFYVTRYCKIYLRGWLN